MICTRHDLEILEGWIFTSGQSEGKLFVILFWHSAPIYRPVCYERKKTDWNIKNRANCAALLVEKVQVREEMFSPSRSSGGTVLAAEAILRNLYLLLCPAKDKTRIFFESRFEHWTCGRSDSRPERKLNYKSVWTSFPNSSMAETAVLSFSLFLATNSRKRTNKSKSPCFKVLPLGTLTRACRQINL